MKKTRILSAIIALLLTASLMSACSDPSGDAKDSDSASKTYSSAADTSSVASLADIPDEVKNYFQVTMPEEGETVAVMHTSMGDICMKFFPDEAPKTVENFVTHAKDGYYNGLTFHRIVKDFMIQGGDPMGTGVGGESIWGATFEDEFSDKLANIYGSVAMANSGSNTNGSQFFINQNKDASGISWETIAQNYQSVSDYIKSLESQYSKEEIEAYKQQMYTSFCDPSLVPDIIKKLYESYGGNYFLDGAFNTIHRGHAVFAQVYSGMDVVDSIAAVSVDENSKPLTDVVIDSVEIIEYKAE